ncbi:degenerin mec-10-like isoform X2 [Haliotis rufescens]|uniref:degenerin mec-10-like isoform X2 n=1 Tax=Haliotis rufescens TaxID=6454 RepID=UPI00201F9846|nr:degenerin mec-10-like isoform X2 [Haliotis rufescens]
MPPLTRMWKGTACTSVTKTHIMQVQPINDNDKENEKTPGHCVTFFTYFAESTSFMGIPKIYASPRVLFKVMWTLLFLTAASVMIMQLVRLFTTFYSYPIKTSVKLGFTALPFPTVTLCNMNPIMLSKAYMLSCDLQKLLKLPSEYQSNDCVNLTDTVDLTSFTETELVCDEYGCYEEEVGGLDQAYVRKEMIADNLGGESSTLRKFVGHDLETMLIECSINGRSCSYSNFTAFLSKEHGNCYTLKNNGIQATKSGPESGLSMVINLESEDFIDTFKTGYGLRVVIHDNGTRPFPGTEGFTVSAGSESSIAMKLVKIERLGGLYGACNDSAGFQRKFGVSYSERACREFCLRNIVIETCKCQPASEATDSTIKICTTDTEFACEDRAYGKYMVDTSKGADICKCGSPCSEKVFETSVSSRLWPVLAHVRTLEQQACLIDSYSPKCTYSAYDFDNVDLRTLSASCRMWVVPWACGLEHLFSVWPSSWKSCSPCFSGASLRSHQEPILLNELMLAIAVVVNVIYSAQDDLENVVV